MIGDVVKVVVVLAVGDLVGLVIGDVVKVVVVLAVDDAVELMGADVVGAHGGACRWRRGGARGRPCRRMGLTVGDLVGLVIGDAEEVEAGLVSLVTMWGSQSATRRGS